MKIAVCGIACEKCPRMVMETCPDFPSRCVPRENEFCKIASCAFAKGFRLCFACAASSPARPKADPIAFGYCQYISGKS